MAMVNVENIEQPTGGGPLTAGKVASSASSALGAGFPTAALIVVAVASVAFWLVFRGVKPHAIGWTTGYVPFAGVIAASGALERFLEPLSLVLLPTSDAEKTASDARAKATTDGGDPSVAHAVVKASTTAAATAQAALDQLKTTRQILFWAIASILGLAISGIFGFFLLQSVATTPVNSYLDLTVTGLFIGAGTKPIHDLVTSMQTKAAAA